MTSILSNQSNNDSKRKRRRRNKSLSRKVRGGNAKTVSAPLKASFIRPKQNLTPSVDMNNNTKLSAPTTQQQIKSLRNAKNYQRRKVARQEMKVESLKDEILLLKTAQELSEHRDKQTSIEIAQVNAAKEKADQLLKVRMERFTNWRQKMEEEMRRCKHVANQRILALETKYMDAMDDKNTTISKMKDKHAGDMRWLESKSKSQIQKLQKDHASIISRMESQFESSQYRTRREHTKTVVSLQNDMERMKRKAEYVLMVMKNLFSGVLFLLYFFIFIF